MANVIESNNLFSLSINGTIFQACWESMDINKSMGNICDSIAVSTVDFFEENQALWNIKMGDLYIADLDGQVISTGYIDEIDISYSGENHTIEFRGRSKTCDLVDCSYYPDNNVYEFENKTVLQIIKLLCLPFNITVKYDLKGSVALSKIVAKFTVDQGSPVFEDINKLCVQYGILPFCTPLGELYLFRGETNVNTSDILTENNVIDGSLALSNIDRFSKYIVKGSGNSTEFNIPFGEGATSSGAFASIEPGIAKDLYINRNRPFVIMVDGATDQGKMKEQALYESRIRYGNSRELTYTVQGWTQASNGKLWKINQLVNIVDQKFNFEGTMLINNVNYNYASGDGFITKLTLVSPLSYSIKPIVKQKGSKKTFDIDFPPKGN